jgi:hypothetical protein
MCRRGILKQDLVGNFVRYDASSRTKGPKFLPNSGVSSITFNSVF